MKNAQMALAALSALGLSGIPVAPMEREIPAPRGWDFGRVKKAKKYNYKHWGRVLSNADYTPKQSGNRHRAKPLADTHPLMRLIASWEKAR